MGGGYLCGMVCGVRGIEFWRGGWLGVRVEVIVGVGWGGAKLSIRC